MTYSVLCDGADRNEWLAARNCGIGASEVPILFGCGYSDSSELDLYARKVRAGVERIEETEGMGWGKRLEGAIIEELAERAELGPIHSNWLRNNALLRNDEYPHLVCTPDGITSAGEPLEVKNICQSLDDSDWEFGIPERFNLQIQSQIAVMGASRGLFGALLFGGRLVWSWVPRDDKLIAEIRLRVETFWDRILTANPPTSNGTVSARKAALAIANKSTPKELFEGEICDFLLEWESLKARELAAKDEAKRAEKQRRAVEDSLAMRMGSAKEAFTVTGWGFQKTQTKRSGYTVAPTIVEGFKIIPPKTGTRAA